MSCFNDFLLNAKALGPSGKLVDPYFIAPLDKREILFEPKIMRQVVAKMMRDTMGAAERRKDDMTHQHDLGGFFVCGDDPIFDDILIVS